MTHWTTDGYPGDEDSGAMGSWYVFSVIGIFPCAGQDLYLITRPSFQKVTVQMENGNNLVINGTNASSANKYIQSATLNGSAFNQNWFKHTDIKNGATFTFVMGSSAGSGGTNVTVYQDTNYGGTAKTLAVGTYTTAQMTVGRNTG